MIKCDSCGYHIDPEEEEYYEDSEGWLYCAVCEPIPCDKDPGDIERGIEYSELDYA